MIQLRSESLMFTLPNGESIPCSVEEVTVELIGDAATKLDPNMVHNAASAVLHYFKEEMGKSFITVGEFAVALAKVLRGFGLKVCEPEALVDPAPSRGEPDLLNLAALPDGGCELFFFPRLRDEVRSKAGVGGGTVRMTGLRPCVKRLLGARRWSARCERLSDEIVGFLRGCYEESFSGKNMPMEVR